MGRGETALLGTRQFLEIAEVSDSDGSMTLMCKTNQPRVCPPPSGPYTPEGNIVLPYLFQGLVPGNWGLPLKLRAHKIIQTDLS